MATVLGETVNLAMPTWKRLCQSIIVVSLLFFAIPLKISDPEDNNKLIFNKYIKDFNKTYSSNAEEYDKRYKIFKDTLHRIKEYNFNSTNNETAKYGMTMFSDLTEEEFFEGHLNRIKYPLIKPRRKFKKWHNYKHDYNDHSEYDLVQKIRMQADDRNLPLKFDWRDNGLISIVRDQGSCTASWAFSAIHTIETMYAIKYNFTSLSVQQMIDCAENGNQGCLGGNVCNLLDWLFIKKIFLHTEKEYPYVGKTNKCQPDVKNNSLKITIKDYTCMNLVNSEIELMSWVVKNGPIAVAVNALSWQHYLRGTIQFHCNEDPLNLNHAIEIVGYDLTADIPYYIGKNSWGLSYGDEGYVHLAIGI